MAKDISTDNLLQSLFKTSNISRFINHYNNEMISTPFECILLNLCHEKNVVPEHIIRKSGIERSYGHQLFNGRRKPSRDKVIQLAFGFEMDFNDTQNFLKLSHKSPLYPKIKRDAVIIYALEHKLSIDDVQETLYDLELPLLGEKNKLDIS